MPAQPPGLKKREFMNRSLSDPAIEREMMELLGAGRDPLEILLDLEEKHEVIESSDLEALWF